MDNILIVDKTLFFFFFDNGRIVAVFILGRYRVKEKMYVHLIDLMKAIY